MSDLKFKPKKCAVPECNNLVVRKMVGGTRMETVKEFRERQTCSTECGYKYRHMERILLRPSEPIDLFILGVS